MSSISTGTRAEGRSDPVSMIEIASSSRMLTLSSGMANAPRQPAHSSSLAVAPAASGTAQSVRARRDVQASCMSQAQGGSWRKLRAARWRVRRTAGAPVLGDPLRRSTSAPEPPDAGRRQSRLATTYVETAVQAGRGRRARLDPPAGRRPLHPAVLRHEGLGPAVGWAAQWFHHGVSNASIIVYLTHKPRPVILIAWTMHRGSLGLRAHGLLAS